MSQGGGEPTEIVTNLSDSIMFFVWTAAENGIF